MRAVESHAVLRMTRAGLDVSAQMGATGPIEIVIATRGVRPCSGRQLVDLEGSVAVTVGASSAIRNW